MMNLPYLRRNVSKEKVIDGQKKKDFEKQSRRYLSVNIAPRTLITGDAIIDI